MTSSSSVKELPPGDPNLTASIVSHLKSRGLFDKLRRDCLGDVDTKPAYLNLKQRIEGYITKFLSTQTWTPDMNKNHVRDMMRREINESGMLSAGMDHLVDQIVNPKIYHVFTPEVENGVRQYLGLSSEKDSSTQQPPVETVTDSIIQPPPPQTPALPPLPPPPPKSEFSIGIWQCFRLLTTLLLTALHVWFYCMVWLWQLRVLGRAIYNMLWTSLMNPMGYVVEKKDDRRAKHNFANAFSNIVFRTFIVFNCTVCMRQRSGICFTPYLAMRGSTPVLQSSRGDI